MESTPKRRAVPLEQSGKRARPIAEEEVEEGSESGSVEHKDRAVIAAAVLVVIGCPSPCYRATAIHRYGCCC